MMRNNSLVLETPQDSMYPGVTPATYVTSTSIFHNAFIAAIIYSLLLIITLIAHAPAIMAYALLFAMPLMGLLLPRTAVCFVLMISAISPLYLFSAGYPDPYAQMVLNLGVLSLNFNGSMVLILLLTSFCIMASLGKPRGLKIMAMPFLPFLLIFTIIWVLIAPTQQGIRSMTTFLAPAIFASALFVAIRGFGDIEQVERSILVSVPLAVGMGLMCDVLGIRPVWSTPHPWSPVPRFYGSSIAPHMAMYCLPSVALLLGRAVIGKGNVWKFVAILIGVVGLTISRTAFFTAIFLVLATIVFIKRNKTTAIIAGLIVIIMVSASTAHLFFSRSFGITGSEVVYTSGRMDMWEAYAKLAMKRPWLGYGIGQDILFHEKYAGTKLAVAHNDYLRLWFSSGIIGLAAYLFAMTGLTRKVWPKGSTILDRKTRWAGLMALLGFALMAVTDNPIALILFTIPTFSIIAMAIRSREIEWAKKTKR